MKNWSLLLAAVALFTTAVIGGSAQQRPPLPQTVSSSDDERALVGQYCLACHSEAAKTRGLDSARKLTLDTLNYTDLKKDGAAWERVVRKLRAGMMPPAGMPRPEKATYESMVTWLETELDRDAPPYAPPPGLHRLNRTEYANVVRDLLDLDIDPGKYLPSDDSTYGFDNIAGALGLSSTLVEAYVSAAQKIGRLAMGYPEPAGLVVYRPREDTSQDYHVEGLPFGTRGGMLVDHVFPSDGEYRITITPIFGDNMSPAGFGSVPCEQVEILFDGERLTLMPWVGGGRQNNADCGARGRGRGVGGGQEGPQAAFRMPPLTFKATAGEHAVGVTFLATNYAPVLDLDRHFMRSTVQTGPTPGYTFFPHIGTIRIEGPFNATPAHDSPSRRKVFICRPKTATDEPAPASAKAPARSRRSSPEIEANEGGCARRILTNLAGHAFRRPATAADVNLLMAFFEAGRREKDFDLGIEQALARILASPQFVYRIEEEPATLKPGQAYAVNDVDLASRLSFFLWSRGPDEELLKIARQGTLRDPAVLEAQVRRMLKDPRAEALAVNFAGQWLNLRAMDVVSPLPLLYPDFDDPLRQSMRREVELLFDTIIREDRGITELLDADYTFVDERLAKHYGIPNIVGSRFRRVTLGPDMEARKGLIGKGAFLATSSKPERTSPVTRGKWIMTNILGMSPPDPPPNVPPLPPRAGDANAKEPTMREMMLTHRVRPDCVQCHRLMDPIGFSLEAFDAIGTLRSADNGQPLDVSAELFDNTKTTGPAGLRAWLTGYSNQFVTVASEKLLTYALGRGLDHHDMPLVRAIARDARAQGNRFSVLVMGIVKSKPFQTNVKLPAGEGEDAKITRR
jgi:hypothetical protein